MDDYFRSNRSLWNEKTGVHVRSDFYNMEQFKKNLSSLNKIELEALGDIKGKSLLHLQCHFGQDTLSLAKLGADVTGVDISDESIRIANQLKGELNIKAKFIDSNVYDLDLSERFDIVFTSYGVITWLPDLEKWAEVISRHLKQGGTFYMVEFHPALWMFNADFSTIEYSYFNANVIHEVVEGTYAERGAKIKHESFTWNHPLCDVLNSLIRSGLRIIEMNEYPFICHDCFADLERDLEGRYTTKRYGTKLPMLFSVKATF